MHSTSVHIIFKQLFYWKVVTYVKLKWTSSLCFTSSLGNPSVTLSIHVIHFLSMFKSSSCCKANLPISSCCYSFARTSLYGPCHSPLLKLDSIQHNPKTISWSLVSLLYLSNCEQKIPMKQHRVDLTRKKAVISHLS